MAFQKKGSVYLNKRTQNKILIKEKYLLDQFCMNGYFRN